MPYASRAQQRLFHAKEARGEISSATVNEFDTASKGKALPARKGRKSSTPLSRRFGKGGTIGGSR